MRSARFFLIIWVIFATFTCSKKVNQAGSRPRKVTLIPTAADTSRIERGIDAVPDRNAIRIEWIQSADENVVDYEIYRRQDLPDAKFTLIATVAVPDSFFEDAVPSVGVRYFYTVRAVNDEDLKSETGDTLSYLLLQKPRNLKPTGIHSSTKPVFTWSDPNQAHEYIFRIVENTTLRTVWISVVPTDYGNPVQSIVYNADQKASLAALISGSEYRWRVDVRGQNNSGSESEWMTLKIQ